MTPDANPVAILWFHASFSKRIIISDSRRLNYTRRSYVDWPTLCRGPPDYCLTSFLDFIIFSGRRTRFPAALDVPPPGLPATRFRPISNASKYRFRFHVTQPARQFRFIYNADSVARPLADDLITPADCRALARRRRPPRKLNSPRPARLAAAGSTRRLITAGWPIGARDHIDDII